MNANWSGETKNEVKVLPFIGGGWAEEFWDLDESKLESSNPADIAGEGRAGGGVCRQALNHTYTVSTHHILDTSIRKGHARRVSAGMQYFTSARCIKLAGNKESQHSVPTWKLSCLIQLRNPILNSHQVALTVFWIILTQKINKQWTMFGGKIQLWLIDTSRNLKISSLFGHIPLGQAIGAGWLSTSD